MPCPVRAGAAGEPVVAPGAAVDDLVVVDRDQALGGQPVQGRVQGAGQDRDLALGQAGHLLDHAVPVPGLPRQGGQDPERGLTHRLPHAGNIKIS